MWLGLVWKSYALYFFKRERESFTTSLMPLRRSSRTETQSRVPREQDLAIVASEPDACVKSSVTPRVPVLECCCCCCCC